MGKRNFLPDLFVKLLDLISREYARKALLECNEIAEQEGLSKMTLDEINAEIMKHT